MPGESVWNKELSGMSGGSVCNRFGSEWAANEGNGPQG